MLRQRPLSLRRDAHHYHDLHRPAGSDALGSCAREPRARERTICRIVKPCARMVASVQPRRLAPSSSSARRREGMCRLDQIVPAEATAARWCVIIGGGGPESVPAAPLWAAFW
jgi:hypothetical protein